MDVESIMTSNLMTIKPGQIVRDVFDLFNQVSYHHVPVVSEEKLVGIISDRDVSRNLSHFFVSTDNCDDDLMDRLVSDIMTTNLVTIDKSTSIDCASILLLENNISCLPIVNDDEILEGLLTWKDILEYYVYAEVSACDDS